MKNGRVISIWFFIGIALLVNGVLILTAGLYELSNPPEVPVVLFQLHANVWWGTVLLLAGALFCARSAPSKSRTDS